MLLSDSDDGQFLGLQWIFLENMLKRLHAAGVGPGGIDLSVLRWVGKSSKESNA